MASPRKHRKIPFVGMGGVLALVGLLAGCDGSLHRAKVEETRVLEFMSADVARLAAFAENGHIHVRPSTTSDMIRVEAKIEARGRDQEDAEAALAAVEILTPRTGAGESTQEVRWAWKGRRPLHWSATVSFDIEMPAGMELAATTDNGEIETAGITGSRELESDNGRIRSSDWDATDAPSWDGTLAATDAKLIASTDNGPIDIESAAGSLVLSTDNGQIKARSSAKQVKFSASNGAIEARLTTSGRLDGRISTDNGSVELVLNPEVSTRLDCKSDHGRASTLNLPKNEASNIETGNRVKCAVGAGEGMLEIKTDNGSISIEGMPKPGKIYH